MRSDDEQDKSSSTKIIDSLQTVSRQQKLLAELTPAQSRAARSLLGMTQSQLARLSELGLSTVVDFERERRSVSEEAAKALRLALEKAGVEFIDENGGGPGVRLGKPKRETRKK